MRKILAPIIYLLSLFPLFWINFVLVNIDISGMIYLILIILFTFTIFYLANFVNNKIDKNKYSYKHFKQSIFYYLFLTFWFYLLIKFLPVAKESAEKCLRYKEIVAGGGDDNLLGWYCGNDGDIYFGLVLFLFIILSAIIINFLYLKKKQN